MGWMTGVQFPPEAMMRFIPLRYLAQTGSGAHSPSYPVGTGGSFPGNKAAGA